MDLIFLLLCNSIDAASIYRAHGIPTRVISDSAVGSVMERVDVCLVGAEGVTENGGVLNKVRANDIMMDNAVCLLIMLLALMLL